LRAGYGYAVEKQKIVFKGKTMTNEQKVGELGMKKADYFLLMVQTTVKLILTRELSPDNRIRY
jgi:hypothetical protein